MSIGIMARGTQLGVEWDRERQTFTIRARLHPDLDGASWSEVNLTFAAEGNLENLISALRVAALRLDRPITAGWDGEYTGRPAPGQPAAGGAE